MSRKETKQLPNIEVNNRSEKIKGYAIGAAKAGFIGAAIGGPIIGKETLSPEDFEAFKSILLTSALTMGGALLGYRMTDGAKTLERIGWSGFSGVVMATGETYILDTLR